MRNVGLGVVIVGVAAVVVYAGIAFVLGHNVLTEGWWE